MSENPLVRRLGQVAVNVHDVDRARLWYRDVLGLRHLFDAPGMAFFDVGGVRLMLSRAETGELDHLASILYYDVEDIHAVHRTLVEKGVRFEDEPHVVAPLARADLWMAFFRDSEGNLLALHCEVART